MRVPPGLELVHDVSAGGWLNERLLPFRGTGDGVLVGEIIPTGFEAYARILHPALLPRDRELVPVRWSELAAERGKVIYPEVQLASLLGEEFPTGGNSWGQGFVPEVGSLPEGPSGALGTILTDHTSADACCFCLWEGFGFWGGARLAWTSASTSPESPLRVARRRRRALHRSRAESRALAEIPTLGVQPEGPEGQPPRGYLRSYYLFRGRVAAVRDCRFGEGSWFQSPNLWWPDDRAWCVATEIDADSTYVGGSRAAVDAVLASSDLEALASDVGHRFDYWGDTVNGPPSWPLREGPKSYP